MKSRILKYKSIYLPFKWMFVAFVFLGQTTPSRNSNIIQPLEKWDYNDIVKISRMIDQISYFRNHSLEFQNTYGGLLAPDNLRNELNIQILRDITTNLERIRTSSSTRKTTVINALESDYQSLDSLLLPPEYWSQIKKIENDVSKELSTTTFDAYSLSGLALINSLLPYLDELLKSDIPITTQRVIESYFKVKTTQLSLELITEFIEKNNSEFILSVFKESDVKFIKEFNTKNNYQSFFKDNSNKILTDKILLNEYQKIKKEYYTKHYKALDIKIKTIYDELKGFESELKSKFNNIINVANLKVAEQIQENQKLFNHLKINSGEYIDIFPPNSTPENVNYWIRANIPIGTLKSLELQGEKIKNVQITFSLMYKIKTSENASLLKADDFLGGKILQADTHLINNHLNNMISEIPLGFSVQNVTLTKSINNLVKTRVYTPENNNEYDKLSFNEVGIHLPEDGPWTNYKQLHDQQSQLINKLGVNQELGVEISRVHFSDQSLMPILKLKINSSGLLKTVLSSDNNLNSFEIDFGKLDKSLEEILHVIKSEIYSEVENRINVALNTKKDLLKEMLIANSVDAIEARINGGILTGKIKFTPKSFKLGNEEFPIKQCELLFQSELVQGKASLKVSSPNLVYESYIKKYIQDKLRELKGLEELVPKLNENTVLFNLLQKIQFNEFSIDLDRRKVYGKMWLKGYENDTLFITLNKNGIQSISGLEKLFINYIKTHKELIESQFKNVLKEECQSFFSSTSIITLFTLDFKLKSIPNCTNINSTFIAEYVNDPKNKIELLLQADGKVTVSSINAPIIFTKVEELIKKNLDLNLNYVHIQNPRFNKGELIFDLLIDIPQIAFKETLDSIVVKSQPNGGVSIHFNNLDVEGQIKQRINQLFVQKLNTLKEENLLKIDFSSEGNGIEIIKILPSPSTDLFTKKIGLEAKVTLVDIFEIKPIKINIDIESGKLNIDMPNIEGLLLSQLEQNIRGEIVPGLKADIEVKADTNPIRLEGSIQIELHGMKFPSMGYVITKNKIQFHPNLSFPIPGHFQIVDPVSSPPGLVLTNGNATLDLEKKQLRFSASMTVGEANTAPQNSRLINMRSSIASYYEGSRLGDFELQANVILVSVLNVMEGNGTIKTSEGCFKLETRTKGPLRDVFKFDQQVKLNCSPNLFLSKMEVDVLGLKSNQILSAVLNKSNNTIDMSVGINHSLFSGAELGGKLGTTLEINNPLSFVKNARANCGGRINLDKFTLSGVELDVNYYNASMDFTVLGMQLGIGVPNVGDITKGKILEHILNILDFDPKAVLEVFKDPTKIKLKIAPMGVGESVKSSSKGKGNQNNSNGAGSNSTSIGQSNSGENLGGNNISPNNILAEDEVTEELRARANMFSNGFGRGDLPMQLIPNIFNNDRAKPKSNLSQSIPENLKAAIEIDNRSNWLNWYSYEYIHEYTFEKIKAQNIKIGGYAGCLERIKTDNTDSICYLINNKKHCFEHTSPILSGLRNFIWRYSYHKPSEKIYIYLTWYPYNYFVHPFSIPLYKEIEISNDEIKNVTNSYIKIINDFKAMEWDANNEIIIQKNLYLGINDIFYFDHFFQLEHGELKNNKGKRVNKVNGTGFENLSNLKFRKIERALVESLNEDNIVVVFDNVFVVIGASNKLHLLKEYTNTELKDFFYSNIAFLDSTFLELDENMLNNLGIAKSNLINTNLKPYEINRLNLFINRLIREPQSPPSFSDIIIKRRKYQIWNTSKDEVNEFINFDGNTIIIDNSDLFKNLGITGKFDKLKAQLKTGSNDLARSLLANLSDNVISHDYKYFTKKGDSLIFVNSNWDFLIQKKDTLAILNGRIQNNSHNLYLELKDGSHFNKSSYFKKHETFISKVITILTIDSSSIAKIENENGSLIAYFLNKESFKVVWERENGELDSISVPTNSINSTIQSKRTNSFSGETLIKSINSKPTLDELITVFKNGFIKTDRWFDKPDKIQPLIIFKRNT